MAILIDGGFYRIRAAHLWGKKTPEQRVTELKNTAKINDLCNTSKEPIFIIKVLKQASLTGFE